MRNITKIFILVFSLILLLAVSCSNDDKTGVKNNPPEDMEITDGETESGGTGSGSSSGGSSGTETGGGTGSGGTGSESSSGGSSGEETGGGTGSGGTGSGSGSGEGGGGTETPPSEPETPTEPETIEGYFPPPEGKYRYDSRALQNYRGSSFEPKVSYIAGEKTQIEGTLIIHGSDEEDGDYRGGFLELTVSKWKKTTKGGKITKTEAVEIEGKKILMAGRNETPTFSEVIYDYETKTLSITCKVTTKDGIKKTLSTKSKKY